MKTVLTSALVLIGGVLPALAHGDAGTPVHAHPHGAELLLALPLLAVAGMAAYLYARR